MDDTLDGWAPWSRLQKQAIFGLPMSLGFAVLMAGRAIFGEHAFPRWVGMTIAAASIVAMLAMIVAVRRGEATDERDRLIMLKATRRAFGFLLIGIMLPGLLVSGSSPWDAAGLARGTAMLALSVYFGSVLWLYRSLEQD